MSVDRDESVHIDVVGNAVGSACKVQHRRPEQRMEINDVLADKVNLLGIGRRKRFHKIHPVFLAIGFKACKVPDGGIEPDIKVLSRSIGNFDTEIRGIARDVPVRKVPFFSEPLFVFS